jgi:hypothetical protein
MLGALAFAGFVAAQLAAVIALRPPPSSNDVPPGHVLPLSGAGIPVMQAAAGLNP